MEHKDCPYKSLQQLLHFHFITVLLRFEHIFFIAEKALWSSALLCSALLAPPFSRCYIGFTIGEGK